MFKIILLSFIAAIAFCGAEELDTTVHIKNGTLRGSVMKDRKGGDFVAFQSIPYAKPPVGNLRFKVAQPTTNWTGVRDATTDIPVCVQIEFFGSTPVGQEDCLYLNVYTPKASNATDSLRPVMVFIHGGGFTAGSGSLSAYGPEFLISKNVIVVAINYRLGALGFLSVDQNTIEMSANNGLKDQVLALKWLQENIRQFGGNPDLVTIFGESAGSGSVHLLILSPLAKGLFHRAIAESGVAVSAFSIGLNNSAIPIANELNISTENTADMIKELKKVSPWALLEAQSKILFPLTVTELTYGPAIIEGAGPNNFLIDHPKNLIKSGNFNKVPFLVGFNNKECIIYDMSYKKYNITFTYNYNEFIPYYLDENKSEEIAGKQLEFYFNGKIPKDSKDVIDLWTDLNFIYDTVWSAKEQAKAGAKNIYLYEFSMDTELNIYKKMDPVTAEYKGASHMDELGYLFNHLHLTPHIKPGSKEEISIDRMITLWSNFAIYGNPTPVKDELLQNQIWTPVTEEKIMYMQLGNNLEAKLYNDAGYRFWHNLYEEYEL